MADRISEGEHPDGRSAPAPGPSGPRTDQIERADNRGRGTTRTYDGYSTKEALVDLLTAYRVPLGIAMVVIPLTLFGLWWAGALPSIRVPPVVWSALFWSIPSAIVAGPTGYLLLLRFRDANGVEILDIDPVTADHRHERVGDEILDNLIVKSPWGSIVSIDDLKKCTVNGREGYELMDLRVFDDGTAVCVAPWVGEASATQFRTYRMSYSYAKGRMSRRAQKYSMLRANSGEIAHECAERAVAKLIVQSETTGMPHGGEIQSVVDSVMAEKGLADPVEMEIDDRPSRSASGHDQGDGVDADHSNGHREDVDHVEHVDAGVEAAADGGSRQ